MRFTPRHGRFLIAFALGVAAGLAAWALSVAPDFALLAAADVFFLAYLALTARIVGSTGPEELRRHAEEDDEGVALILLLAALAGGVSVIAIFLVLMCRSRRARCAGRFWCMAWRRSSTTPASWPWR